jgi:hypothetical protein
LALGGVLVEVVERGVSWAKTARPGRRTAANKIRAETAPIRKPASRRRVLVHGRGFIGSSP